MRTLLITYYWRPYNNAGAFRWLGFTEHIPLRVLTCRRPLWGMKDQTMPDPGKRVYRFGYRVPAVLWGLLAVIPAIFSRYDVYIVSSPPESLLFTAWVLQLLGRRVIVDMRDSITRERQFYNYFTGVYKWLYSKMQIVIVSSKAVDPTKEIVYNGFDDITRDKRALDPPVYYRCRVNYETYILLLRHGFVQDFSGKPAGYGASSLHTIRHLGYDVNIDYIDDQYGVHCWEAGAWRIVEIIKSI